MISALAPLFHPESNGIVERSIKSIKALLDKLIEEDGDHDNWESIVAAVQMFMNSQPHYISQFTPFQLVFNREATFFII